MTLINDISDNEWCVATTFKVKIPEVKVTQSDK